MIEDCCFLDGRFEQILVFEERSYLAPHFGLVFIFADPSLAVDSDQMFVDGFSFGDFIEDGDLLLIFLEGSFGLRFGF